MGVWIETAERKDSVAEAPVTPCMGVWIETMCNSHHANQQVSHPVWVCGLKHHQTVDLG